MVKEVPARNEIRFFVLDEISNSVVKVVTRPHAGANVAGVLFGRQPLMLVLEFVGAAKV
jgi:hypothetical protein